MRFIVVGVEMGIRASIRSVLFKRLEAICIRAGDCMVDVGWFIGVRGVCVWWTLGSCWVDLGFVLGGPWVRVGWTLCARCVVLGIALGGQL